MLFNFPHLVAVLKSASSKSRDYAAEYRDYHGKPAQIKERAQRNAARRKLGLKPGDGKEADHKNPISNGGSNADRNLRAVKRSTNRKKGAKVGKAGWEEDKHPRADNGQFGSGSGGSSKPASKKPSKNKRKQERRAEEASQGKVTGAIQTLLSGGSALDNVKWFKQPEAKPKPSELDGLKAEATQISQRRNEISTRLHRHDAAKKPSDKLSRKDEKTLMAEDAKLQQREQELGSHPLILDDAKQRWAAIDEANKLTPEEARGLAFSPMQMWSAAMDIPEDAKGRSGKKPAAPDKPKEQGQAKPKLENLLDEISGNAASGIKTSLPLLNPNAKKILRNMSSDELGGLVDDITVNHLKGPAIPKYLNQKYPEKPKRLSLVDQANSMKRKDLRALPMSKLRAMQEALQKPTTPDQRDKNRETLRHVEGAIYSKV